MINILDRLRCMDAWSFTGSITKSTLLQWLRHALIDELRIWGFVVQKGQIPPMGLKHNLKEIERIRVHFHLNMHLFFLLIATTMKSDINTKWINVDFEDKWKPGTPTWTKEYILIMIRLPTMPDFVELRTRCVCNQTTLVGMESGSKFLDFQGCICKHPYIYIYIYIWTFRFSDFVVGRIHVLCRAWAIVEHTENYM